MAAYLLAALNPYMSAGGWWLTDLMGLCFPWLFGGLLLLALAGLFIHRRWSLAAVVVLLAGTRSILGTFAFHFSTKDDAKSYDAVITVMTYNVHEFKPVIGGWDQGMQRFWKNILPENPDILCLQELNNSEKKNYMAEACLEKTGQALSMPFGYFSRDYYFYDSLVAQGSVIYTRFPVIDSGRVPLGPAPPCPSMIYADVVAGGDTLRVMTTHLESFRFGAADYQDLHQVKTLGGTAVPSAQRVVSRLREVFQRQHQQADRLAACVRNSPYPVILCGDLNAVPNGYTYRRTRGGLQDAFLKKGWGLGTTFSRLSSTLRIDYIFADPAFRVAAYRVKRQLLSDHYAVVARIILP